ncbi:fimbria/pilus outer membrane usher protein [Marinobacter sp. X15-166B]|uniref:fimbria/pilus outer membrane usher protein n=1 Tax=Marinobacter sp. X15-166B TaxID=1897620 RepID=UPI001300E0A4|nr:fimbria/pilus outer membrane usher protein [Marinobacter sp. X15-166B]
MIDEFEVGAVTVGLKGMNLMFVDGASFVRVVENHLEPAFLAAILAESDEGGDISVEGFEKAGLGIDFNQATLKVAIRPTEAQRKLKSVSSARRSTAFAADSLANISAYMNYNINQGYVHQSGLSEKGAQPLRGFLDGALNFGFLGPVTLEWAAVYDEEEEVSWARDETRLIIDDQSNAIRYAFGDVSYQSGEFQGAPNLLGMSIERLYQTLQPFNNITATGQQTFTVDKASRVEVFVNGILQSTQRLTPGRYNLSDFSFAEGLNDIELLVTDDLGRVEKISYSLFLDSSLLKRGISEFSLNAGYRRQEGFQQKIAYDFDRPAASGFYRYGITNNLTAGVQIQGEQDLKIYGIETLVGTPIGTFGVTASSSESETSGRASAGAARWKTALPDSGSIRAVSVQFASIFNERNYMSLGQDDPNSTYRYQHQARVSGALPGDVFIGLAVRKAQAHQHRGADEKGVSISLSRRFRWFTSNVFIDHVESDEDETSIFAGISVPLGNGRQLRGRYDRLRKTTGLNYSDFPVNVVGDWSGSAEIVRVTQNEEEHRASGSLSYTANRFVAGATHDYAQEGFFEGETEERTLLEFSGAFVITDGHAALSRPVYDAFVLVTRHQTLSDTKILVNETLAGPTAIANNFGSAVIPSISSYRKQEISWRADNLPSGYDLGNTNHHVVATYKSGSHFTAGSGANVVAIGTVASAANMALKAGIVRPTDGRDFPDRQTFTNRNGRFVVQKLEPGTYEIDFGSGRKAQFSIPADQVGYMDLGTIIQDDEQ